MIKERPFIPKWSIVGSYRPGMDEQREGVFKGMRQKGLVSDGLGRSLHRRTTGRFAGQVRLYCVLNQDAARLARHGFEAEAARLVKRAGQIERSKDAKIVVDAVLEHVTVVTANYDELISKALVAAVLNDAVVHEALLRVSDSVDAARLASKALTRIQRIAFGRVTSLHGDLVDIMLQEGRVIALDADTLAPHNLARVGAALVLHWENWGKGQAFFEAEPGIDLGGEPTTALQKQFAFLRPPTQDDEVWAAAPTIAGAVKIERDVPIARSQ